MEIGLQLKKNPKVTCTCFRTYWKPEDVELKFTALPPAPLSLSICVCSIIKFKTVSHNLLCISYAIWSHAGKNYSSSLASLSSLSIWKGEAKHKHISFPPAYLRWNYFSKCKVYLRYTSRCTFQVPKYTIDFEVDSSVVQQWKLALCELEVADTC